MVPRCGALYIIRCSHAAGPGRKLIPTGFVTRCAGACAASAPLGFESQRLEFLTGLT
jgi:hypothetical protein